MPKDSQGFERTIALRDLEATNALGARIAAGLLSGDAVALEGDLGAGKTTLARAILQALGVSERVPSPTFTLVQCYETPRLSVRHFDLYRIESESDIEELGLDDALDEGAVLIEWPQRAGARLPRDALHIALSLNEDGRAAHILGPARWASTFRETNHVR